MECIEGGWIHRSLHQQRSTFQWGAASAAVSLQQIIFPIFYLYHWIQLGKYSNASSKWLQVPVSIGSSAQTCAGILHKYDNSSVQKKLHSVFTGRFLFWNWCSAIRWQWNTRRDRAAVFANQTFLFQVFMTKKTFVCFSDETLWHYLGEMKLLVIFHIWFNNLKKK